ncbi:hypothetical protein SFOMI_4777 [Sphingobium fuliginis]|uniref:Uncharacterized protein n=1 Tax=Sphingobium fuliginis (strain ATCC 27551) TaxID=336203 RepID=A0A292ZL96_SPHSA|nr:hypothetical protein SFOMI_4777 [Sphingobium fuliginis]
MVGPYDPSSPRRRRSGSRPKSSRKAGRWIPARAGMTEKKGQARITN